MPRWDSDGGCMKDTLFECAAYKYDVRATCGACGHAGVLQPHALWWRFSRCGWDERLRQAGPHLRCNGCDRTGVALEPNVDPVTVDALPMPPKSEWKRAVDRFRN